MGRGFAASLCAAVVTACTSATDPGGQRAAIVHGTATGEAGHVVAIGLPRIGCADPLAVLCSGALIAPRVVLTAAHCVANMRGSGSLEVFFGDRVDGPGTFRIAREFAIHPDFDPDTNEADLALLRLDEDAMAEPSLLPAGPLAGGGVGARVRLVGFGSNDATAEPDGVKRQGFGVVTDWMDKSFRIEPSPAMTCHGDSGGPAFLVQGDVEVTAGITSFGDPSCQAFGVDTRVDIYVADFVAPFVTATPSLPAPAIQATDPLCTAACSSSSDCPLGLDCLRAPEGGRCVRSGLPPGEFREPCEGGSGDACTRCVRLHTGPCRTYTPCDPELRLCEDPGQGGGCHAGGRPEAGLWALLLLLLVACIRYRPDR